VQKKIAILMIVNLLLFSIVGISYGETEEKSITYNEAVNRALDASGAIEDLSDSMEDVWEQRNDLLGVKQQIQEQLDQINRFEDLYEKKYEDGETLTPAETQELQGYQMFLGDEPPTFTNQEMLDQFIKQRDFPHEQLLVTYNQLKNQRALLPDQLEAGVRDLYIQLLNLRSTLEGQEIYTSNLENQLDAAQQKFELGQISSQELLSAKNSYLIQKLSTEQLERTENILSLNFKNMIGLSLDTSIKLTSNMVIFNTIDLQSIEYYEGLALENRAEVIDAKNVYEMEKREADIIKEYLDNPLTTDRLSYDAAVIDAKNAYDEAILDVKEDITKGYFATEEALEAYEIKLDEYRRSVNDLKDKREMYNLGMIDRNTLDMVEFSFKMSKDALLSSRRTLELNYYKLEKASQLGPAFESSTGGAR
jgi:hypothetical protein